MAWVYILQLANNKYYIGSTTNLEQRIFDHSHGKSPYTKKFLPVKLLFSKEFNDLTTANKAEKYIKKLKSRIIIEKIVNTQNLESNW